MANKFKQPQRMENNTPISAPSQPPHNDKNEFDFWKAVLLFLESNLVVVPFLIILLIIGFATGAISNTGKEGMMATITESTAVMLFSILIQNGYAIWKGKKRTNINSFNFTGFSFIAAILLILTVFTSGYLSSELITFLQLPDISKISKMSLLSKVLEGIILAPILEEILFRGIILEAFLKKYDISKAILFSALLFGIVHFNPPQILSASISGLILGWVYYRTKSLLPCIFMHFVNNLLAFAPSIFPKLQESVLFKNGTLYSNIANPMTYVLVILGLLSMLYVSIRLLDKQLKR